MTSNNDDISSLGKHSGDGQVPQTYTYEAFCITRDRIHKSIVWVTISGLNNCVGVTEVRFTRCQNNSGCPLRM